MHEGCKMYEKMKLKQKIKHLKNTQYYKVQRKHDMLWMMEQDIDQDVTSTQEHVIYAKKV